MAMKRERRVRRREGAEEMERRKWPKVQERKEEKKQIRDKVSDASLY